jgi:hypothetical protein
VYPPENASIAECFYAKQNLSTENAQAGAGTPASQCGTGVPARQIVENGLEMSKLQAWVRKEMKFALQGQPNAFLSPLPEIILLCYVSVAP